MKVLITGHGNKSLITKDKEKLCKFMFDELEKLADIKEQQLKSYDRMMCERSEIDVSKCKGRD